MDDYNHELIREVLLDKKQFLNLTESFIHASIDEKPDDDPNFIKWYTMALETVTKINTDLVFDFSESPIEKIFLNSLLLGFIKADSLGLIIHPFYNDAETELSEFYIYYKNFLSFLEWYDRKYNDWTGIEDYLDNEMKTGKIKKSEREYIGQLTFRYHYLQMKNSYHLTLQPKFPNIIVDGKSIRPDLLFWLPSHQRIKVIVECDGFEHHSNKDSFISDRRRDRILQSKGFQVLRYSGSEIYNEPIKVAGDILNYLWELKPV